MGKKAIGSFFVLIAAMASAAAAQEPAAPTGPEAYWKLDETSGSSAVNSVAGGQNGAYTGSPTPSTNVPVPPVSYANARSLGFNGTSTAVTIPSFGTFNQTTVSCWVYPTGSTGTRQSIVSYKEGSGVNMGFVLCLEGGANRSPTMYVQINGGWQNAQVGTPVPLNTWTHLAGTYDGTLIRLYVNGTEVDTGGGAGIMTNNQAQNTVIGARASYDQHWFPGLIDDVRIYSRGLPAADVAVLAAGCPAPTAATGTYGAGTVALSWTAPAGSNPGYSYRVKRSTTSGGPYTTLTTVAGTTYTDNTATPGSYYYYVITAVSAAESGPSNEVVPPVTALPQTGLFTSEVPQSTTFNIVFTQPAPAGGSVVQVVSNTPTEGTVSTTFPGSTPIANGFQVTVAAAATPTIPVTVTGANDLAADGPQPYTVTVTASNIAFVVPNVQLTNNDDEIAGVTFSQTSGLGTTESGGQAVLSVSLNTRPFGTITMTLTSSDPAEGTVGPGTIIFTPTNWNTAQVITLTGVDDTALDFTQAYTIVTSALSAPDSRDFAYAGMNPPNLDAFNLDDEPIPPAPGAWGGGGSCGLLGLEIVLSLLLAGTARRMGRRGR